MELVALRRHVCSAAPLAARRGRQLLERRQAGAVAALPREAFAATSRARAKRVGPAQPRVLVLLVDPVHHHPCRLGCRLIRHAVLEEERHKLTGGARALDRLRGVGRELAEGEELGVESILSSVMFLRGEAGLD
eukprot:4419397-Prymnesium_polylepis.1